MLGRPLNLDLFRCPSDDVTTRVFGGEYFAYRYSYSMNAKLTTLHAPARLIKMTRIRNPAGKVLLYEEDENTIDDGFGDLRVGPHVDLLAIRHDRERRRPDNAQTGLPLNGDRQGNALFCDGHGEYTTRVFVHDPDRFDPDR